MYSYLKGIVTEIKSNGISLEVSNIGYDVRTPSPYDFKIDEDIKVYIHHYVREDAIHLYGFKTNEGKSLFIKLLSVKGIGPKSAIAILASGNVVGVVNAIENGDANFLSKFPGIGPKASQQIILDLKGKIDLNADSFAKSTNITEVEEALKSLGYRAKEIIRVVKGLDGSKQTHILLKEALAKMLK